MTLSDDSLRTAVRDWLTANWDSQAKRPTDGADLSTWLDRVYAAGWLVPRWQEEWGGSAMPELQARIVEAEFRAAGAPGAGTDRTNIPANTLIEFGPVKLARELVRDLVTARVQICLLYSEPGAGSDLASVRTRAERQGDRWVITGQKVWTSGALTADYGLLVARTDWDVPKHEGISFFFLPMKQKGVDVRPLHQITGDSHFNEVFLDGVEVPAGNLVGPLNGGWRVLQTALGYERLMMGEGASERRQGTTRDNRLDLIALARSRGKLEDPVIRQEIAQAIAWRRLNELNGARAKAEMNGGTSASPIMSLGKLAMSRVLHNDARVARLILGAEGLLDGADHAEAADMNYRSLHAYMNSIGGGTDQIQRNIIGERVLGLPRELEVDRNIPFNKSRAVTG